MFSSVISLSIIITLFSSIVTKKNIRYSGHWPQLHHTDWLWWWQVQTKTNVELVCSNSQVSIRMCCGTQTLFASLMLTKPNKYVMMSSVFFFSFLFRNRAGGKRTSFSWKQRVFMLLLVGVLGFFTLIIIMAKLGRASAGSDPNLDPLLNPNIRVGKNWWQAVLPPFPSLLHNISLCRLCRTGTVNYKVSPAEGAVRPT